MAAASRLAAPLGLRSQIVEVDVAVVVAATTTTFMPGHHRAAALVPCALEGMRHTLRPTSPRLR